MQLWRPKENKESGRKKRREGSTRLHIGFFFAFIQTSIVFSDFFWRNTALKNKNALVTFDVP